LLRAAGVLLVCILILFLSPAPAWADGGSLSGTVKHPSGAVIMGATITAHNVKMGVQQTVKTNESRFYAFSCPGLEIVLYDIYRAKLPEKISTGLREQLEPIRRDNI
jgi:hypothetical protein